MRRRANASTDQDWTGQFLAALRPKFVRLRGRVFAVWSTRQAREYRRLYRSRRPSAADENTDNHYHVDFAESGSLASRVSINHHLAEAIAAAWQRELTRRGFRGCRLVVMNEYSMIFEGDTNRIWEETIVPTIRLWSAKSLDAYYEPAQASPRRVSWSARNRWFDLAYVLRFIALPRTHPRKRRIIERYYRDESTRHVHYELTALGRVVQQPSR